MEKVEKSAIYPIKSETSDLSLVVISSFKHDLFIENATLQGKINFVMRYHFPSISLQFLLNYLHLILFNDKVNFLEILRTCEQKYVHLKLYKV